MTIRIEIISRQNNEPPSGMPGGGFFVRGRKRGEWCDGRDRSRGLWRKRNTRETTGHGRPFPRSRSGDRS